jgi:LmbE family N-acetylglucosaminyl deacetylase
MKFCQCETKRVLATGAHFDDVEVGIGGTLLKHAERGDEIFIAILNSDEHRTGEPKIRLKEQKQAFKLLGVDSDHYILFKSTDKYDNIVSNLDKVKPDIIYTPYEKDTHQAHRRCSKITQSVGRKKNITTIFYYCGSSIDFNPNLFSIIDFNKKLELIQCHQTQIDCGALKLDIRRRMEAYWATLVSYKDDCYAEGLIIRKMIYGV